MFGGCRPQSQLPLAPVIGGLPIRDCGILFIHTSRQKPTCVDIETHWTNFWHSPFKGKSHCLKHTSALCIFCAIFLYKTGIQLPSQIALFCCFKIPGNGCFYTRLKQNYERVRLDFDKSRHCSRTFFFFFKHNVIVLGATPRSARVLLYMNKILVDNLLVRDKSHCYWMICIR